MAEIAVVGSLNTDLVATVEALPLPGETVMASSLLSNPGGKGANQAVAAARLGRSVAMVGAVGDDEAGKALVGSLRSDGVATHHIRFDKTTTTGAALIAVDALGENMIVVSPGANATLTPADIEASRSALEKAVVVLVQQEIPPEAVRRCGELSAGTLILNPAPARDPDPELLALTDVLVPNQSELARLTGGPVPNSLDEVVALATSFEWPRTLVVTMGGDGAVLVGADYHYHVPAPEVDVVDATAAGDAFCGALADAISQGRDMEEAVEWA
ncbi:MAG: ribokinase, partial [Acidimicrobiia bacterium]|nr:ribokinase [Acidimicrobiia bacterium]